MRAFLSHASADKPLATALYRALRQRPVSVWFDRVELRAGDALQARIADGIAAADVLLVLLTPAALSSPWVQSELSMALAREAAGEPLRVIPLLAPGCEVPAALADRVWVPLTGAVSGADIERDVGEILPAILRDHHVVDIDLDPVTLQPAHDALVAELAEAARALGSGSSGASGLCVRIDTHGLLDALNAAVARGRASAALTDAERERLDEAWPALSIALACVFTHLAEATGAAAMSVFDRSGPSLDSADTAATMTRRAFALLLSTVALKLLHAGVLRAWTTAEPRAPQPARLLSLARPDGEPLLRHVMGWPDDAEPEWIGLEGAPGSGIGGHRVLGPECTAETRLLLGGQHAAEHFFLPYEWDTVALPQIVWHAVRDASFARGQPLRELPYRLGWAPADYPRAGFV